MKTYHFKEARPLRNFIQKYQDSIIGHTLTDLYTLYWPVKDWRVMSEKPVILQLDDYCLVVNYYVYSDMEIVIGNKEELKADKEYSSMLCIKNELYDYYDEEYGRGIPKEQIEGRKIIAITVEHFSKAFEYNTRGDMRPSGGDYFSTLRLFLDSGTTLCLCGLDAEADGYIHVWCE